jgi:hypothetical protein
MAHSIKQTCNKRVRISGRWVAFAISILIVLSFAGLLALPVIRGHQLLTESRRLRVGYSDFSETSRIATAIGATKVNDDACLPGSCTWVSTIDNGIIPEFWRGKKTTLGVTFTVEGNRLVETSMNFGRGSLARDPKVDIVEQTPLLWKMKSPISINSGYDEDKRHTVTAFIRISPSAKEPERARYSELALTCLSKFRGCADVHQLLPNVPE